MTQPVRKGAPPVGLWLKAGPDLAINELLRDLRQIFFVINNGSGYERNMHALEIHGDAEDGDFRGKVSILFALARVNGIAAIFRGEPARAKEMGADGVLVESVAALEKAKDLLDLAGLACGVSQDLAAQAHDANADFVSFSGINNGLPPPDLLRFWTILSDKPALIEGNITNDYCAWLVQNGAGFIDASAYIWSHGKGVMQGTVNMLHAIELALDTPNYRTED